MKIMKTSPILFIVSVLIFSIVSTTSLVSNDPAYAQDDPNVLLRIAIQADEQIHRQLDEIYDTIPLDIQDLYSKGHSSVESLRISLNDNNIEQARQDFLNTMKSFKQITQMISEPTAKASMQQESSDILDRDLASELNRLYKYFQNLKEISEKQNTGIDFAEIELLFTQAYQQIDYDESTLANETLMQLESLIDAVKRNIHQHSSHSEPDRFKIFAAKQLDKIKETLQLVQDSGYNDNLSEITESYSLINEIESAISQNDISTAKESFTKLIKTMKIIEMLIR